MCGGTLEIHENETVAVCEYCGAKQTLPKLNDEIKVNLYDRAHHFRRNNEFDKAMSIYEQILNEDPSDAEAYWSLVLCRYGIEYVEDPVSHKRIPTVNRAQFTSIFDDVNYKSALQYADSYQKPIYEEEAKAINEIQKGILAISQNEEPYDIFICYKETDNNGRRTPDSVLANDLYHQLTQEGFKVFFSRITLEDKLGTAYEPYIFAALNSAKIMVVLGTRQEYFNAVWVKNEWSRYLSLIKNGAEKILIPAYRDMNPYNLPEEFSHLQAQDMSKLGFMQDLIRGIKKIIHVNGQSSAIKEATFSNTTVNINALIERAYMFLEDEKWIEADKYFERVLDQDPKNARAYLGKLLAELNVKELEELENCECFFDDKDNYKKAIRFANEELKTELINSTNNNRLKLNIKIESFLEEAFLYLENENWEEAQNYCNKVLNIDNRNAKAYLGKSMADDHMKKIDEILDHLKILKSKDYESFEKFADKELKEMMIKPIYERAKKDMSLANTENGYKEIIKVFQMISKYQDSMELIEECNKRIEQLQHIQQYNEALSIMEKAKKETEFRLAAKKFREIKFLKEAEDKEKECLEMAETMRKDSILSEGKSKMKGSSIFNYESAIKIFEKIPNWKSANDEIIACRKRIEEIKKQEKEKQLEHQRRSKRNKKFIIAFSSIIIIVIAFIYVLNTIIIPSNQYKQAMTLMNEGKYAEAYESFSALGDYKDSKKQAKIAYENCLPIKYEEAISLMNEGQYEAAISIFEFLGEYKDSEKRIIEIANIGDIVTFGSYEQDNDDSNGKEKIKWIVLDKTEDQILVISKCGLDCQAYNYEYTDVTWEICSLRGWLNNEFINSAFTEEEQSKIAITTVINENNPSYDTYGGNDTQDKIFLLSINEANKYFNLNEARKCVPTDYAIAQGDYYAVGGKVNCWWLRSPGYNQKFAAGVNDDGSVYVRGSLVERGYNVVRPALWINLKS